MYKRVVITLIAILLAACACFIGIHEYLRRTEIEQKEKLMHIALAQKQAELMLQEEARKKQEEDERRKREAVAKEEADKKAAYEAQEAAKLAEQQAKTLQVIEKIEKSVRKSFLKNFVLQLNNPSPVAAEFDLKCSHLDGGHKTLHIVIDPYQSKEISFQEGWTDNFVPGEKVEALVNGKVVWTYVIP